MRRLTAAIVAAIVFLLLLPLGGCGAHSFSETFGGYLSETTYSAKESAVVAFVDEQLCGAESSTRFRSYRAAKKLSAEEIENLFPDESRTIEEAERGSVTYLDGVTQREQTANVYLVKTDERYRYFAPLPQTGERVTTKYFESVTQNPAYRNCTVETTFGIRMFSLDVMYYQTVRFADDRGYLGQKMPGPFGMELYMYADGDRLRYIVMDNDTGEFIRYEDFGQTIVLYKGGNTYSLSSFSDIEEFSGLMYAVPMDPAFLVKTKNGFRLTNENYKAYVMSVLRSQGATQDDVDDFEIAWDRYRFYAEAEFEVTQGRFSKISVSILAFDEEGNVISLSTVQTFDRFGTTSLELPEIGG